MVVADEVREARVVAAVTPACRRRGGGERARAEGERGAEQARAAQELAPGDALGVEVGGETDGSAQVGSCCSVMMMRKSSGVWRAVSGS